MTNIKKDLKYSLRKELLEVYEKSQQTKYIPIKSSGEYVPEKQDTKYKFTSNSGNNYEVDFFVLKEPKTILIDNKSIIDISSSISDDKKYAYLIGISFTIEGRDYSTSDDVTNKNEQYEVINKVSYLFEEFLKDSPEYNIFFIGTETHRKKLDIYNYIFNKQFKDKFYYIKGQSRYSKDNSGYGHYFIKK